MIEPLLIVHEEGAMIRIRRQLLAYVTIFLFCSSLLAQSPETAPQEPTKTAPQATAERSPEQRDAYRKAMEDADQKIAGEVKAHSELMKNLEYLTTQIGPRLTGSPQMQAASQWTLKRFQDYHVEVHLETAEIAHGWTRGVETAEITSPIQRRIGIHALGWSKATDGEITGSVMALNITKPADLEPYKGKLKGAIVLLRPPVDLSKLDPSPENAYDAVIPPARGVPEPNGGWRGRPQLMRQGGAAKPTAVLTGNGDTPKLFH